MKKTLKLVTALFIGVACFSSLTLSSCNKNTVDIAFCMSQANELNEAILENLETAFPDQVVRSENANSSSATQTDQVNNFITLGAKMIVVSPVSLEALQKPLNDARAEGIKVVVSGATAEGVDCYDAVTTSDEFLLGCNVAQLAKNWAEDNMQGKTFDTVICVNNDFETNIHRSNGLKIITEPKLKNVDGQYIDENGNVVSSENEAADNPAYCSLITEGNNRVHEFNMTPNQSISEYMPTIKTMYPNAKLFILYGSLAASTMSNYIVSNSIYADELEEYAIFGGGVSGTQEPACLLGSLDSGVGQSFTQSGQTVTGIKSIFRGAVSFGGADAAKSVVDLCKKVYEGTEGVDYVKENVEPLGIWYTIKNHENIPDTLGCYPVTQPLGTPVRDFDAIEALNNENNEIKWQEGK